MEENITNTNESTENTEPAAENTNTEANSEEVTYTQAQLESEISRAVNAAVKKVKERQTKSNDELTIELNELKAQLQRKENETFVSAEINSRGIPAELSSLFYGEDNDVSKEKLNLFSKWFKGAVDAKVEEALNATKAPSFNAGKPASKKATNFLEFYEAHKN